MIITLVASRSRLQVVRKKSSKYKIWVPCASQYNCPIEKLNTIIKLSAVVFINVLNKQPIGQ
jgi:hypothetical protein